MRHSVVRNTIRSVFPSIFQLCKLNVTLSKTVARFVGLSPVLAGSMPYVYFVLWANKVMMMIVCLARRWVLKSCAISFAAVLMSTQTSQCSHMTSREPPR